MLLLGTTSARSKSVSLEIYSYVQSGLASCEISGYRPTTFSVHKTILSGKFGKERSLFKKVICVFNIDLPVPKFADESLKMQICFPCNNRNQVLQVCQVKQILGL